MSDEVYKDMEENGKFKNIFEWIVCILIALVIVVFIKTFIGFPTVVSGSSMDSTLKDKQRLWVSRIGIEFDKYPERGSIITFEAPTVTIRTKVDANLENPVAIYKDNTKGAWGKFKTGLTFFHETSFIKRVIGLPGDHIVIKNNRVYVNDEPLKESYLSPRASTNDADGRVYTDIIVPDGYVYVLGDNRENSVDSRMFGCIPVEKIEGKATFRFWPLNKIGTLK